jgi:hypothetical protein
MDLKWIMTVVVIGMPAMVAVGCSTAMEKSYPIDAAPLSNFGTVEPYTEETVAVPIRADSVMIRIGGDEKPLASLFDKATILVLSDQPCISENSKVGPTSDWADPDVAILEVTSDPAKCSLTRDCAAARGGSENRITSLCDSSDAIRRVYNVGPGTVVLVLNRSGHVAASGPLSDYDSLREQANSLARNTEDAFPGDMSPSPSGIKNPPDHSDLYERADSDQPDADVIIAE